ncbi:MAG: hypothetical protein E6G44_03120, partial [Actinobacteria bacterium]
MAEKPGSAALERLVGFGRYLRSRGLPVGTGRVTAFCRAAVVLDPFDATDLRWAARATLVSRHEDFAALDEAFDAYFGSGAKRSHGLPQRRFHSPASLTTRPPRAARSRWAPPRP